jgi:hypothetical protein
MVKIAAKRRTSDELERNLEEERRVMIDIPILLFKLVVLRVYLGRSWEDDFQIYYLARSFDDNELASITADDPFAAAKRGLVIRLSTIPEQVLLAAEGVPDTRTAPTISLKTCNLKATTNKSSGTISDDYLLASPLDLNKSPYIWGEPSAFGLYRGPRVVIPGLRPTPRPKVQPDPMQLESDLNIQATSTAPLNTPKNLKRGRDEKQDLGDSEDETDNNLDTDMDDANLTPVQQHAPKSKRRRQEKHVRFDSD